MSEMRKTGQDILKGTKRTTTKEIDLTSVDPRYIGEFSFKTPSLMDRMQIGVIQSNFLKGTDPKQLDVMTQNIAYMSATLAKVCTDYPDWFDLDDIGEYIVLETVYDAFKDWEASFRTDSGKSDDAGDSKPSE